MANEDMNLYDADPPVALRGLNSSANKSAITYDADPPLALRGAISHSGKTIAMDPDGIENVKSRVKLIIDSLESINNRIIAINSSFDSEVLSESGASIDLHELQIKIRQTLDDLNSNYNGFGICQNEFFNADKILANAMKGMGYLASGVVAGPIGMAAYNLAGQAIKNDANIVNTLFGLYDKGCSIFTDVKNTLGSWFNNAKDTVKGVLDNKWVKVGLAGASIVGSIGAIAASGILTVFTGGVASPGAVVVTAFGVNNIISQTHDIWAILNDENDKVGNCNIIKNASKVTCSFTAEMYARGMHQVGLVSEDYIDVARQHGENAGALLFDAADVLVGNIQPSDASKIVSVSSNVIENADKVGKVAEVIDKVTTVAGQANDLLEPVNKFNDMIDWADRLNDLNQYGMSKQEIMKEPIQNVFGTVKNLVY